MGFTREGSDCLWWLVLNGLERYTLLQSRMRIVDRSANGFALYGLCLDCQSKESGYMTAIWEQLLWRSHMFFSHRSWSIALVHLYCTKDLCCSPCSSSLPSTDTPKQHCLIIVSNLLALQLGLVIKFLLFAHLITKTISGNASQRLHICP